MDDDRQRRRHITALYTILSHITEQKEEAVLLVSRSSRYIIDRFDSSSGCLFVLVGRKMNQQNIPKNGKSI